MHAYLKHTSLGGGPPAGELSFQTLVDFAHSIRRVKGRGSQARKEAMVQVGPLLLPPLHSASQPLLLSDEAW